MHGRHRQGSGADELLIAGVSYQLNGHRGRHKELTVGPVDG
jgi:hypothetical protein